MNFSLCVYASHVRLHHCMTKIIRRKLEFESEDILHPSIRIRGWRILCLIRISSDDPQKSSDILGFYPSDNNTDGYPYPRMTDICTIYPDGG